MRKIYVTGLGVISGIGKGVEENLDSLKSGKHGMGKITLFPTALDVPVSEVKQSNEKLKKLLSLPSGKTYSRTALLGLLAAQEAARDAELDFASPRIGLISSTSIGGMDASERFYASFREDNRKGRLRDIISHDCGSSTEMIAAYLGVKGTVTTLSTACSSAANAIMLGARLIRHGLLDAVLVGGTDALCRFTLNGFNSLMILDKEHCRPFDRTRATSGFLSFRSLSSRPCRPYDSNRDGLNLGEACGAVLLSTEKTPNSIILSGGAISNDANHISGPSRTGDGLYFAIRQAMQEAGTAPQDISFVNAHGTATVYNDEMESKALTLAHLEQVPVHSLKPYFGHTLGASGIIESIVCMHELKQGILFGTPGYETPGVPMPIPVYATHQHIPMKHCVKTASGFGGCNAAIVLSLPEYAPFKDEDNTLPEIRCTREVRIENSSVFINNELIFHSEEPDFGTFIRDTYKKTGGNNLKFYKMDDLCKLGYVAAEYLLKDKTFAPLEMGMLLANAASSLHTDIRHQQLIDREGDQAASPAVFVYTLPNVVSGEICIRHKIQGENTFFITKAYQPEKLERYARIVMQKGKLNYCIIGWCELLKNTYKAVFKLIEKQ